MRNLLLIVFVFLFNVAFSQKTVLLTKLGKIEGTYLKNEAIKIFKGIPFAAPPIGDLRWKAPQAPKNWEGFKNCTAFSASPVQNKPQPFYCWSEEFIAQPEPLSEDCLYLNVWTKAKRKKEKLPVFVWIYGGGLNSGSANCAIYDGLEMAKKGIVFVSVNYRVGVFGFMAHPELSAESGKNASGNYGFLDQIAALKWIQQNIEVFGGDAQNVTIAGQSAGAFSVTALIASPLAKGLFHKAIAQSGGLLSNMLIQDLAKAENQGMKFMKKANVDNITKLREISALDIQKMSSNGDLGQFGTTLDGYVLPADLNKHFKNKLHNKTPLITGWVTGDGSFFPGKIPSADEYKKEAKENYGMQANEFLEIFPGNTNEEIKANKNKLTLLNFAGQPAHLLASYNSRNSYLYQFSHVPVDKPNFPNYGAFHTSEVPFALHTLHTWNRPWREIDREVEEKMSNYWVNFAKTGNPNGKNLSFWPKYENQKGEILSVDKIIESKAGLMKKEFDFLEKFKK